MTYGSALLGQQVLRGEHFEGDFGNRYHGITLGINMTVTSGCYLFFELGRIVFSVVDYWDLFVDMCGRLSRFTGDEIAKGG